MKQMQGIHPEVRHALESHAGTPDILDSFLLDRLEDVILSSCAVPEFLQRLAVLTSETFSTDTDPVLTAIALLRDRKPVCMGFSSEPPPSVEKLEYAFRRGPAKAAVNEEATVHISDLQSDPAGGAYADVGQQLGVRSLIFVPLNLDTEGRAGLTLYSARPNRFDAGAVSRAEAYARRILKPLRIAARLASREEQSSDLRAAMESRTTIDLAMGIVMGQNRCGQDEAFTILRSACSRRNIKLRDLAALLVASVGERAPRTHFDF